MKDHTISQRQPDCFHRKAIAAQDGRKGEQFVVDAALARRPAQSAVTSLSFSLFNLLSASSVASMGFDGDELLAFSAIIWVF